MNKELVLVVSEEVIDKDRNTYSDIVELAVKEGYIIRIEKLEDKKFKEFLNLIEKEEK